MRRMWQPSSFAEFHSKTRAGYVSIDISNHAYKQFRELDLPAVGITQTAQRYLYLMTTDETIYHKMWNTNIDLYLHDDQDMTRIKMPLKVELLNWIASKF